MFGSTIIGRGTNRAAVFAMARHQPSHNSILCRRMLSSMMAPSPSSRAVAIEKARLLFAEYRETHYRQCLPSRFRKEVMKAAMTDPSKADRIDMNGLRRVFANIGAIEQISEDEIQLIFEELGNDVGEIDIPRFKLLVCPR